MRSLCVIILLSTIATLVAGCAARGVLDPQGPVGEAEKTILLNSLGIMLAIVIPTIVATLGVRVVVPRVQQARPLPSGLGLFRPDRDDRLGDPGTGGVVARRHRLGRLARSRPTQAAHVRDQAAQRRGGLARLEMAVHLPGSGHRERQPPGRAGGHADQLPPDIGDGDEQLLRAAAWQPDLRHGGHGDAAEPAGRQARHLSGAVRPVQRRRLLRHALRR